MTFILLGIFIVVVLVVLGQKFPPLQHYLRCGWQFRLA